MVLEQEKARFCSSIADKEALLKERDDSIASLKYEVQQLGKFKHVLEFELAGEKRQTTAQEARIEALLAAVQASFESRAYLGQLPELSGQNPSQPAISSAE